MEQDLQQLFEQAVLLLKERDLKAALRCFRVYLAQGGEKRDEARDYLSRIEKLATEAGRTQQERGSLRRAREQYAMAMDAKGEAAMELETPVSRGEPEFSEIQFAIHPESESTGRLWRRPHMDLSESAPVAPDENFHVLVYANQSDPQPGESAENIELPDTGMPFYDLEVRLLSSAHFRLDGPETRPFRIDRAKPTTETVDFSLTVVNAAILSELNDRPASVCAEFLYQGRPSGKVRRNVKIAGVSVPPAAAAPEGLPKMHDTITVDLTAKLADLLISITAQAENDNRHFWCTVETRLLPEYAKGVTVEWTTGVSTGTLVAGFMEDFTKAGLSKIERFAKLRGVGKQLYRTSPVLFQEVFWKLLDSNANLATIAIVSDEPFIPWELMIPHREGGLGLPPEIRDPLGVEFRVGRMTRRAHVGGVQRIPLKESYVVAPVFDGPRNLPHAQEEAALITKLFPGTRIDPADFASLNTKLDPCPSLLHFACHGEVTEEGKQVLYLDDEKEFSAVDLCGLPGPEKGIPIAQPLVFLNACQVGRPVPGLIGVGGFAAAFMEMGASAVVAPLWSVKDTIAHEIAMDFYVKAKNDKSIPFAEILRQQRAKAYDPAIAEDTYAAYCFYGDPLAVPA
jgi:hypothetical protein